MKTKLLIAAIALLPLMTQAQTPKPSAAVKSAAAVHAAALVIDTHADTPQRFVDEHFDLTDPLGTGQVNLESAKKGNLGAEFFSIWVEPEQWKGRYSERTLALIDAVREQAAKHPDKIKLATSPAEIASAHAQGKFAALMGIEGGHSIENSLGLLRDYYALGVRYMTLTWANSNDWADSSGDIKDTKIPHTKEGLTEFGKDVVYEMNRLGMMVDVSHTSDRTFYRTLVISRAPVIASHSDARALCNVPRNMTDEMLHAIKVNDGVVMVNFFSGFLSQQWSDAQQAQKPERDKAVADYKDKAKSEGSEVSYAEIDRIQRQWLDKIPRPPFSLVIDHIDHIAKVAGVDHVGIGSDFDGINGQLPEGIDSAADLPKITAALMARGYSAEDCRKILGGNLLRVFREVEKVSKQLQAADRPRITNKQAGEK
jgi:membrane dipeptidase